MLLEATRKSLNAFTRSYRFKRTDLEENELEAKDKESLNKIYGLLKRLSEFVEHKLMPHEFDESAQTLDASNINSFVHLELAEIADKSVSSDSGWEPRILVVDDEVVNRMVVSSHLSATDYVVEEAQSAALAIEMLNSASERYDLLLLDVMMPGMDGFQLCRLLRKTYSRQICLSYCYKESSHRSGRRLQSRLMIIFISLSQKVS